MKGPWAPANPAEAQAADRAVQFFERALTHTKGRWAGCKFVLEDWQREEIIRPLFGKLRENGTRQFRTAYIEIPRKNGKSELAAGVALKLLFGDDEAGGEVYGAAADRDQASIVFNVAAQMVRNSPELAGRAKIIDSSKRIIVTKGRSAGSVYRAIPADAAGSHGFNASGIVFDEIHTQPNRELWDVLTTSTGAREQPLVFGITTAGFDRESICYELHERAMSVINGAVDIPSFFAYVKSAAETDDWLSEEVWKACNPALDIFRSIDDMRELAQQAADSPALQNTFRRLYLNQWTSQQSRWIDIRAWDGCIGPVDPALLRNKHVFGGMDLASTTDLTALCLCFPPKGEDGDYQNMWHFWIPEAKLEDRSRRDRVPYRSWVEQGFVTTTPGNVVDYGVIRKDIGALGQEFPMLREIAYDPWNATSLAVDLESDGFQMIPIRQGHASLSAPTKEFERLVTDRRLRHGANPVMRWMVDNVAVVQDSNGNIKPAKDKSRDRIDGVVAAIMALDRASRFRASTYEDNRLFVL